MILSVMLDALNESEVGTFLTATQDDLECAESSENEADFRTNIAEAILNAQLLVSKLKELQAGL